MLSLSDLKLLCVCEPLPKNHRFMYIYIYVCVCVGVCVCVCVCVSGWVGGCECVVVSVSLWFLIGKVVIQNAFQNYLIFMTVIYRRRVFITVVSFFFFQIWTQEHSQHLHWSGEMAARTMAQIL